MDDATNTNNGKLLHSILGGVPIVIFAVDRNGVLTFCEGKGLELLRLKPEGTVGRSLSDLLPNLPDVQGYLQRALSGETTSTSVPFDGTVFEVWHTPLRSPEGETVGLAGIAIDISERKRAEEELRAGQQMMKEMLLAHERDRQLIAYEIHDGLVQDATGAQLRLDTLLATEPSLPQHARDQIQVAVELVRKAIGEARQLIGGLRPPILDDLGVVPAIEYLVESPQREGLSIQFSAQVQFDRPDPLLEVTIYRIVQEAITNVRKHSRSDRAEIRLTRVGDRIHLEIQDWGIGFDPAQLVVNRFGLQGIRERARLLRGRALIQSAPGKGTRIFVDLPVSLALGELVSADTGASND